MTFESVVIMCNVVILLVVAMFVVNRGAKSGFLKFAAFSLSILNIFLLLQSLGYIVKMGGV